jgi:aryl-alcohol dehydrogenase-like predicted oxidoreductase
MYDGPGGQGLSRKAIMEQIDASLSRLGTDYIDIYLIHRFDDETPVDETMEALYEIVKAGKARYLGASSMFAWQFAKLQHAAALHGWTPFIAMQDQYNLIKREEEREMLPVCGPGRGVHSLSGGAGMAALEAGRYCPDRGCHEAAPPRRRRRSPRREAERRRDPDARRAVHAASTLLVLTQRPELMYAGRQQRTHHLAQLRSAGRQ